MSGWERAMYAGGRAETYLGRDDGVHPWQFVVWLIVHAEHDETAELQLLPGEAREVAAELVKYADEADAATRKPGER